MLDSPPFSEEILHIGGIKTRALRHGEVRSGRPTLVFLHGWSDSADAFKRLMAQLSTVDAALVSLDLPGFGAADQPQPGPKLPQYVGFASAALDYYADFGVVIPIGQSLGARALLMALSQGSRAQIPGLMAIGPAPLELPPWQKMIVRNRSLAASVSALGEPLSDAQLIAELVKSHKRTCYFAADRVPAEVFEDYARNTRIEHARNHIQALRQFGAELEQPLELSQVRCPVEIIWGAQDRIAPISGAKHYLAALPQARLTTLESCGHHAHLEKPEDVAREIVQAYAEWL